MELLSFWGVLEEQKIQPAEIIFPPMYALTKTGSIRTYTVQVKDLGEKAVLTTIKSTTLGGKNTVDTYEYTQGVNIGKANETTYLQQATAEALSIIRRLQDKGFTVTIPEGKKFNTDAQGKIKPMLAIGFRPDKIKFPCLAQPKYDGVRCTISQDETGIHIISRNGKPYRIPHLEKWAEEHSELLPLDGELYNHKELTFQEIISAVKKVSSITDKIIYVVYDKPVEGIPNVQRWQELQAALKDSKGCVQLSKAITCASLVDVDKYHDKCVSEGYEGVIIRNLSGLYEFGFRSNDLIKLKKFDTDEFEIVDVIEASGRDAGTALFVCKIGELLFSTKPQGTQELRRKYLSDRDSLIGKQCSVQYQGLTDVGMPRFPSAIAVRDYE